MIIYKATNKNNDNIQWLRTHYTYLSMDREGNFHHTHKKEIGEHIPGWYLISYNPISYFDIDIFTKKMDKKYRVKDLYLIKKEYENLLNHITEFGVSI